jgi:NAD(P)-dependent dehydrogenase (short-subunit alcohol dehydrogenase family)
MAAPETRTSEGWELQFATNHVGHFALTTGLRPALAVAGGARVVSITSYDPWLAYGQSKTANVLFAVESTMLCADDGITVNAVMPGGIRTNLQRHLSEEELQTAVRNAGSAVRWKTPEQGAATSVLVATAPLLDGIGGRYFEDCNEAEPHQPGTRRGVAAYALDPEAAERLWEVSVTTLAH